MVSGWSRKQLGWPCKNKMNSYLWPSWAQNQGQLLANPELGQLGKTQIGSSANPKKNSLKLGLCSTLCALKNAWWCGTNTLINMSNSVLDTA